VTAPPRDGTGYRVAVEIAGERRTFTAASAERAYGEALLHLVTRAAA